MTTQELIGRLRALRKIGGISKKLTPRPRWQPAKELPDTGEFFKQDQLDAAEISSQDAHRAERIEDPLGWTSPELRYVADGTLLIWNSPWG